MRTVPKWLNAHYAKISYGVARARLIAALYPGDEIRYLALSWSQPYSDGG
jgi:hypothetical protein